jgi:hypothetical protein
MKSRLSPWTIAANLSPSGSRNNVDVMPANNNPFPQAPSPSSAETRAQGSGHGRLDLRSVPNMQQPSHAADWTLAPLIPLSSFRAPLPQPLQFQKQQPPSSPWAIPTDNIKMVSAPPPTNATMRIEPRFGQPNNFFSRPDPGRPTGFGVAHHQEHFNTETPGNMQGQVPAPEYSQIQRINPFVSAFPPAAATNAPQTFWNWKPGSQQAPVIQSATGNVHLPPGPRLPGVATVLQPATHAHSTPAPTSFRFPAALEASHGPAPYNDNRSAATSITTATTMTTTTTTTGTALAKDNISFYHPMNCRSAYHHPSQNETHALLLKGFSPNYRGDPNIARNQSAAIPAEANCSLFIVGLAPDLTTHELLAGIRNVGRVYATHINPPSPERGHALSAVKLVFFERQSAGKLVPTPPLPSLSSVITSTDVGFTHDVNRTERFYTLHATTDGFSTPLHPHLRGRVTWNRVRSAEVDKGGRRSRVLLVSGPPGLVQERFLCGYLATKLVYQLDEVVHRGASDDGRRVLLELRFGSFRCQAEAARMALMRGFREEGGVCEYGEFFFSGPLVLFLLSEWRADCE